MSFLELSHLSKAYEKGGRPVVDNLSLQVEEGEIVVLLGSSGCGKTTLLKMIAGLETQDAGAVSIDGTNLDGVNAEDRPLAMVFQKALLFRNMTVEQNINFAPRVNRTMDKAQMAAKVEDLLALIDMRGMGGKEATELSGGQEQRVSLARALMTSPKVLLLDEPFSALDAKLRTSMRQHIKHLNKTLGTTMVFVTHDQQEAVEVADRIALMHEGRILQFGASADFYERPNSRAVADFFGWRNFLPAVKRGAKVSCLLGEWDFEGCDVADGAVELAIRPEAVCEVGKGPYVGRVLSVTPQGPFTLLELECADGVGDGGDDSVGGVGVGGGQCGGCLALELLVKATEAVSVGHTLSFDLAPRMMWPVALGEDSSDSLT